MREFRTTKNRNKKLERHKILRNCLVKLMQLDKVATSYRGLVRHLEERMRNATGVAISHFCVLRPAAADCVRRCRVAW